MSITVLHHPAQRYVEVTMTGKLEKECYLTFLPRIEELIRDHGKLRMLVVLHDFRGWTLSGLWEDMKFDFRHGDDLERLAIVGETRWQEGMASFCRPFTSAAVRYFHEFEIDKAREWLQLEASQTN